jgi:hypothetical protein
MYGQILYELLRRPVGALFCLLNCCCAAQRRGNLQNTFRKWDKKEEGVTPPSFCFEW